MKLNVVGFFKVVYHCEAVSINDAVSFARRDAARRILQDMELFAECHEMTRGWLGLIVSGQGGDCQQSKAVSLSIMQWLKAALWLVSIDVTNVEDDRSNRSMLLHSLT